MEYWIFIQEGSNDWYRRLSSALWLPVLWPACLTHRPESLSRQVWPPCWGHPTCISFRNPRTTLHLQPSSIFLPRPGRWVLKNNFTFFFPYCFGQRRSWRSRSSVAQRPGRRLYWIIFVLSIISLIGFLSLYANQKAAAYFLMPFRFWELGFGCMLALIVNRYSVQHPKHFGQGRHGPDLLIFAALIASFFAPEQLATQATVAAVVLTCLLILLITKESFVHQLLTHPVSLWIGLISYSLYLWHWSILSLSNWTIGVHAWSVPFQIVAMIGMATISYYFIEKPLRFADWHSSRLITILFGVLISITGALIVALLGRPLEGKLFLAMEARTPTRHVCRPASFPRNRSGLTMWKQSSSNAT